MYHANHCCPLGITETLDRYSHLPSLDDALSDALDRTWRNTQGHARRAPFALQAGGFGAF
ncbi:hypothetical protein BH23ACT10_BH23ACT10_27900 [soil metagenome]